MKISVKPPTWKTTVTTSLTQTAVEDKKNEVAKLKEEVRKEGVAPSTDKLKAAKAAMMKINKQFPNNPVIFGSQMVQVPRIESGYLTFDVVTGGGFPKERATQVKGPEHSGKTTILLDTVANIQAVGDIAVWINGEEFDKEYARQRGVDPDQLILIPYADGTTMLEQARAFIDAGVGDFMALDSIQTIKTARALKTKIGETGYGSGSPQMWGDFNGVVNHALSKKVWAGSLVWVSQMRAKIGGWMPTGADTDDGTQINTLKHWKVLDVRFKTGAFLKDKDDDLDDDAYARVVKLKNEKNKVGPYPFMSGEWDYYSKPKNGIPQGTTDVAKEIISWGHYFELIEQSGAHYSYNGTKLAVGMPKLLDFMREQVQDPSGGDIALELRSRILARARVFKEEWGNF